MCCAIRDCGRPGCRVCYWGRIRVESSASTVDPLRKGAKAELQASKRESEPPAMTPEGRLIVEPKKKHRVGPHQ